jgi:hypothetical protein
MSVCLKKYRSLLSVWEDLIAPAPDLGLVYLSICTGSCELLFYVVHMSDEQMNEKQINLYMCLMTHLFILPVHIKGIRHSFQVSNSTFMLIQQIEINKSNDMCISTCPD